MIVSHRHRFIFVKTRKTAGTSVEIALSRHCGAGDVVTPTTPEDEIIRSKRGGVGPQNTRIPVRGALLPPLLSTWVRQRQRPHFENHLPAALIRQAVGRRRWDEYTTFTVERNPWSKAVSLYFWRTKDQAQRPSFSDFIRSVDPALLSNYDVYAGDDGLLVDHVIRYETLAQDLADWWTKLGLPGDPDLPKAKAGHRPAVDWRSFYTAADVAFVGEVCRREAQLFAYEFDA